MTQNATSTPAAAALAPLQQLRQELNARFPERREVIDGALCAVLAGEHVLLLGPPDPLTLCASSPSV
jgi:MoxR-like ATPase